VSSLEAAEMCGAAGAATRALLTAAANEMTIACSRVGVDAWEVIEASGIDPPHATPGRDLTPLLLAWGVRQWGARLRLIELASEISAEIPVSLADRVGDVLNEAGKAVRGSRVAILGLAHEGDTNDPCDSPLYELMGLLLKKGAEVSYSDPNISSLPRIGHWPRPEPLQSQRLTAEYLSAQDCALIAIDREEFDPAFIVEHSKIVIDTCYATRRVGGGREKIRRI
jgi:UDP-N-acetyl-D-glucosamine dehydrogenase